MNNITDKNIKSNNSELMRDKQIDEMAKIKCEHCASAFGACEQMPCKSVVEQAESLYNAGYRKQSEGAWITYRCTNGGKSKRGRTIIYKTYSCDVCDKSNGRKKTNYCPNCGAKMKGGAE